MLENITEKGLVSVVIPTYKRPEYLERAINTVVSQSYSNIEIIVVDDNGKNTEFQLKTQKVIERNTTLEVSYIVLNENKGGCFARNSGIDVAKGEFIAFLDDDDEWLEDKIEEQVAQFTRGSESLGAVYCGFYSAVELTKAKVIVHPTISGWILPDLMQCKCPSSTSLLLIKSKDLRSVGGFDNSLESFQDYDLYIRLSKFVEFDFVDKPLAVFNQHVGDRVSINLERRFSALDKIVDKWDSQILKFNTIENFRRTFRSAAYQGVAYSELMKGNSYSASKSFMLAAKMEKTSAKLYFKAVLAIFGFKLFDRVLSSLRFGGDKNE